MKCFQSMMLPFKDSCQQDGGWNCLLAQFDAMTFGLKIVIKQLIKTQTFLWIQCFLLRLQRLLGIMKVFCNIFHGKCNLISWYASLSSKQLIMPFGKLNSHAKLVKYSFKLSELIKKLFPNVLASCKLKLNAPCWQPTKSFNYLVCSE